jgi:uncharacterized protein YgiM (DUF1202 family)
MSNLQNKQPFISKSLFILFVIPIIFVTGVAADTVFVEITADSLNIRSSPDTDSEVIGRLIKGQQIEATIYDPDWFLFVTPDNPPGFISSYFAKIITAAPPTEPVDKYIVKEKTADSVRVEIIADSLNIRSTPNTDSEVIGMLIKGQQVNAAVYDKDWLVVVTWDNRQGFISSHFATIITGVPPAEPVDKDIDIVKEKTAD